MTVKTFFESLDICKKLKVPEVWLHNWGEPLLHPNLLGFVSTAKRYFKVGFATNGSLLTHYILRNLKLDYLDLSYNCSTPEDLKKDLTDLYFSANYSYNIDCRFRSMVFSKEEYEQLNEKLKGYKVRWQRGMIYDPDWKRDVPCPAREKVCVIYWDGTKVPCCRMNNRADEKICIHCREVQDDMPIPFKLC